MKLVRYRHDGSDYVGLLDGDTIEEAGTRIWDARGTDRRVALAEVELLPAVHADAKIICVGLNYSDHAAEAGMDLPTSPVLFAKFSNTLNAHGAPVPIPVDLTQKVDYEAELGVVIGRLASRVSVAGALDHVLGYTCVDDLSARDLQFADGQWVRGKSVDLFGPVGPAVVTTDEVPDPQDLRVQCLVNGEVRQDASTALMTFSVADLISFISQVITLEPGDLIATGTPAGVGVARSPQSFLEPGDEVVVRIGGVGELRNTMTLRAEVS